MNRDLLTNIKTQISSAVSGITSHVYFLYLPPSEELLNEVSVVYELQNTSNENSFDTKELVRYYSLRIKLNAPSANSFADISIYIKSRIYDLVRTDPRIKHVGLVTEDLFFDSELNVFTEYMNFELQYS